MILLFFIFIILFLRNSFRNDDEISGRHLLSVISDIFKK